MDFNWQKPTVQMLGRWQPWHDGHTELFKRAMEKTGQVCIQIRDVFGIDDNPFTHVEVADNIIDELNKHGYTYNKEYTIMKVPNIVDISYGRNVGYTLTEHDLGATIHSISATKIRTKMRDEGTLD